MSVGKTRPAILRANELDGATLYVVPAYLVPQWVSRIQAIIPPDDEVVGVTGTDSERQEALRLCGWTKHFVCGYETFRDKFELIKKVGWRFTVFDEAHRLRGRGSKWTHRVVSPFRNATEDVPGQPKELKKKVQQRILGLLDLKPDLRVALLTGTAQIRDGGDWYIPLRICNPDRYTSYWKFVDEWCATSTNPWYTEVKGIRRELRDIFREKVLAPYVSFRTLDESFTGDDTIPESEQVLVDVQWGSLRSEYYTLKEDLVKLTPTGPEYITKGGALITELRYITAREPNKLKVLKDIINGYDEKVVIWTWYHTTCDLLTGELLKSFKSRGVRSATGQDDVGTRLRSVSEFLSTGRGILVAGLPALQEGIDLFESSMCIFYEHDWVPSATTQAIGRLRRPGQKKVVQAFSLVIPRSVDSVVYKAQKVRGEDVDALKMSDRIKAVAMEG